MSDIAHQIYHKLNILLPSLSRIPEYAKSTAAGFVDLHLDRLEKNRGVHTNALSHYYKHPSGDMMPDPNMTIRVDTTAQTAEALTYQDTYRYDEVYSDRSVDHAMRKSLNNFLAQWLQNCIDQEHRFAD